MTLENISCYKSKAVFPMCMWYHKWQKFVSQENLDPRLWLLRDPRLWFSQFCSLGFHSDTRFVLQCLFPPFGNSDHVVSVSTDFLLYSQWDTLYHIAYDCSCADWDSFCDHLRDVPWEDIFNLCFCCCKWILWVGSGWNWCIPHWKYQVKPD